MSFAHTVSPKAKTFTENDLKLVNLYVNTSVYPGLYSNDNLPKGLRYIGRKIMKINDILMDVSEEFTNIDTKGLANNFFVTQSAAIRSDGRGEQAEKVIASLNTNGFELDHIPISVAIVPSKEIFNLDGRTRLEWLRENKFDCAIVDVYECDNWDVYQQEALKRNPPASPRSPMKKEDIIANCNEAVKRGWIKATYDEIVARVKYVTGGAIAYNTLQKIVHSVQQGQNNTSSVLSLSDTSASEWLKLNGYIDNEKNNGIYYKVVSASAWSKAIPACAKELYKLEEFGKKVKELRVVLHTGTLDAADVAASWKGKIDSFRSGWREDMSNIERAYFQDYTKRPTIKLYGAIPAVGALKEEYPMDKLVMFHVGKLKDKSFLEIDVEESLEENLLF